MPLFKKNKSISTHITSTHFLRHLHFNRRKTTWKPTNVIKNSLRGSTTITCNYIINSKRNYISHIYHVVLNSYGQHAAPSLFLFNAASPECHHSTLFHHNPNKKLQSINANHTLSSSHNNNTRRWRRNGNGHQTKRKKEGWQKRQEKVHLKLGIDSQSL